MALCLPEVYSQTPPEGFSSTTFSGGWNAAVGFTFSKDGKQLFVWEKAGRVWLEENNNRQLLLDISQEVGNWHDHGMLGFALHPQFEENGYFYLLYVVDRHYLMKFGTSDYNAAANENFAATIGRLTRYKATKTSSGYSVDTDSRKILLGETKSTGIPILSITHGVGTILFGTDGSLLLSCGEGSAPAGDRGGSNAKGSYAGQALADGIITPQEDVGAFRSQLLESHSGKILRLDPLTGDGLPSNPFYDPANPHSARSKVYALGLRNPFRMTLKPHTGSHNPDDGDPGVLYVGDVGAASWEELNIVNKKGMNFGWPLFEGLDNSSTNFFTSASIENKHAPNPLYGQNGCEQPYFYFKDLLKQVTASGNETFINPCNTVESIPVNINTFVHSRPAIDWRHHGGPARVGIFDGETAAAINIGATGSPVSGPSFGGGSSTGGVFYTGDDFPAEYKNSYFHGDYADEWIKNITIDANGKPVAVRNFINKGAIVVAMATHPTEGGLYYLHYGSEIRKVYYSANRPPIAQATVDKAYGTSPLAVQFTGSASTDPEGLTLSYSWDFGDGTTSTLADPAHTFTADGGVPTQYTVLLKVTDDKGASHQTSLIISVNNTPPQVEITSPVNNALYPMTGATTYPLKATVTDQEHQPHELSYQWQTTMHHNDHTHPEEIDSNVETSTVISPLGCDGEEYFYRISLTVTDRAGLSTTKEIRLYPNCSAAIENVSELVGSAAGGSINLSWRNPATDFDEVMIIAKEASSVTATPTGDGSGYVANSDFSSTASTPIDGGKVVYKGKTSPQTITGLTNNKLYFFKVFTRIGLSWSEGVETSATPHCPAPSMQASNLSFTTVTGSAATLTWNNGNGSGRIVKINTSNNFTDPADGVSPAASSVYSATGEQVIANGTENTVTVTGLQPNTTYYFRVYEYNCTGTEIKYITGAAANNPLSIQTGKQMPVVTWAKPQDITYGTALSDVQLNATANVPGTFTYLPPSGTILNPGNQTLSADFIPADANTYHYVTGIKVQINVTKASQTIDFAAIPDKTVNTPPFAVTATASSGLPVSFNILSGPATISGNIITLTGTGEVVVRASQAGNANVEPAVSVERSFKVVAPAKQNQSITFGTLPNKTYGDTPFTISATASSNLPVSFSIVSGPATLTGNTVTITGAGTITIRAGQTGNATYNPASFVNQSFVVNKARQAITMGTLSNKTYGDAPFAVTATASSKLPVTLSVISGPATISGNTITLTGAGRVTIKASQPGNANYLATYVNKSFNVASLPKQNQAISFNAIPDKTYGDAPFAVTATASSNLPVTYSIVSGPATIAGNLVTLTGAGEVTIRAAQSGNATYHATHADKRFMVFPPEPVEQGIRFDPIADKTYGDAPFTVTAAASSNLPVTYSIVSGPATIAENMVTLTGAGEVIIRAEQAGNANHLAAPPVERVFCVAPSQPAITATGSTTICQNTSVTLQAPSGFSGYTWSNGETTQAITVAAPGKYTVKVKAGTCESAVSEPVTITVNAGIAANAGDNKTVYAGYAPAQCTQLTATASGGEAPYTYLWNTGATTATIDICPDQTSTYIVTITDSKGCSTTDEVVVNVVSVSCGNNKDKVQVCNQDKLLCISPDAVPAHLAQGYELGTCMHDPAAKADEEANTLSVYPNPFQKQTSIEFMVEENAHTTLEIYSVNGRLLYRIFDEVANAHETYKVNFDASALSGGLYIVKLTAKNIVKHKRILITR